MAGTLAPPVTAVHELSEVAALARRRRARGPLALGSVADRDHAHRVVVVWDAERPAHCVVLVRRDPDEAAAETGVGRGLEDDQARHGGVHVPEGHRPPRVVEVGPALVLLGVPLEVGPLAGAREDHHRRAHHPGQPAVRLLEVVGGGRPEAADVLGGVEHQERPALAEAGARCADGVGQRAVDDGRVDGLVAVVADHAATSYDVLELHGRQYGHRCRHLGSETSHAARWWRSGPWLRWMEACLPRQPTSSGCGPTWRRSAGRRPRAATSASRSPSPSASSPTGSASRWRPATSASSPTRPATSWPGGTRASR